MDIDVPSLAVDHLVSPPVLSFVLAFLAVSTTSGVGLPEAFYQAISIYIFPRDWLSGMPPLPPCFPGPPATIGAFTSVSGPVCQIISEGGG